MSVIGCIGCTETHCWFSWHVSLVLAYYPILGSRVAGASALIEGGARRCNAIQRRWGSVGCRGDARSRCDAKAVVVARVDEHLEGDATGRKGEHRVISSRGVSLIKIACNVLNP